MAAPKAWIGQRATLYIELRAPGSFVGTANFELPQIPGTLLMLVFPPLLAMNLWLIMTLVLNGTAAYWLGLELSDHHRGAAWLGGLVFMAFPNMQGHLSVGHIEILAVYGLPLFALCLWRILYRGAGWRTAAWGSLCLALACLGIVSQIIFNALPLTVFWGLYLLLADRDRLWRRDLRLRDQPWLKVAGMFAGGGAILLVFWGPLLTSAGRVEIETLHETGRVSFSADPLAFVSPSPFGPLDDLGLVPDYARDVLGVNSAEGAAYLGLAALILVIVAVAARREARSWLFIALLAMFFSLGPLLKWRDQPVTFRFENFESYVALPWAALQDLPFLDSTRTPGRFNGTTALAWGALVSIGAGVTLRRIKRPSLQAVAALGLGLIMLVEYQLFWPYDSFSADQPAYFERLAAMDEVRGVLNVPLENPLAVQHMMYQQTIHGKPMVGGLISRRTPQDPAVINILARLGLADTLPAGIPPEAIPYVLSEMGIDRVIVQKRFLPDPAQTVAALSAALGIDPEYDDDHIAAFAVPPINAAPEWSLLVVSSAAGWSESVQVPYAGGFEGAFLAEFGEWYLYSPVEQVGELVFKAGAYNVPRRVAISLDDHLVAGRVIEQGEIRLSLSLTPGFHTLRFDVPDGCTDYPFTLSCLSGDCAPLDPPLCISAAFGIPTWQAAARSPVVLDIELDHGLRLHAYTLDLLPEGVSMRLFWEADHALPHSYALFAHLADPVSGEPLAQDDDFPAVLTTDWGDSARWVSDVVIPLPDDLPAGDYAINVGWFDPVDGSRLAVQGDRPWASVGIVHLEMVKIP
ncbi:MAG: hypothetical protein HY866_11465, partial [Chloroflexi bacterium]|nr:hypothetical protein [Chloroflexota bacterium]